MYVGGSPAQALAQLDEAVRRSGERPPEALMRTIIGLLKMAHDLQLPPTCFMANTNVELQGTNFVRIMVDGHVTGGG